MIKKKSFLNFLGIILLILGIFRLIQIIFIADDFPRYFWLCNFAPLILGLAILLRNPFLLIGKFSILFFGQILWTIDFLSFLFTGSFLTGTSEYILYEPFISQIASVGVHILVIPIAFMAILMIGKESKKAWTFSFILFPLLLPIVLYYGPEINLNLFFYNTFEPFSKIPLYSLIFPLAYVFLVVLPLSFLVNYFVVKFKNLKQKK